MHGLKKDGQQMPVAAVDQSPDIFGSRPDCAKDRDGIVLDHSPN
jgi:hypothetical protein